MVIPTLTKAKSNGPKNGNVESNSKQKNGKMRPIHLEPMQQGQSSIQYKSLSGAFGLKNQVGRIHMVDWTLHQTITCPTCMAIRKLPSHKNVSINQIPSVNTKHIL